ncbi:MAG: hypothetical protein PUB37_03550, partial [Firmicutes bacterium]|nr:hypothetical protein [Bacillota bacterium]
MNISESKRINRIPWKSMLSSVFFFALIVRLVIGMCFLNSYDTEWNIMWGIELGDGFFSCYAANGLTSLDYPPLYLYPLYIVGRLMQINGIAGYPPFRMLAIKFLPCLADSLTCLIFYKLGSRRSKALGLFAAGLWAINPASLYNCAFWGQTDCVMMCMAALLFLALQEKRLIASGVLFGALCTTKLQGLYLTPVVGMELLTICFGSMNVKCFRLSKINKESAGSFFKFVGAVIFTAAAVFLPFMIGSAVNYQDKPEGFLRPLTVYGGGLDKYPYCTMNADNLYRVLGLNGVNDEFELLPGISVSLISTVFLLLSVSMVAVVYVLGRRKNHWLAAYMLMECIFMLTSRQHERYQILTLIMLMGAFLEIADRRILPLFSLHVLVIFSNQARVLSAVHEKNGWWMYYSSTNEAMNSIMRQSMELVSENGADWLQYSGFFGDLNAALNMILFAVSIVFVFRYYFDSQYELSL